MKAALNDRDKIAHIVRLIVFGASGNCGSHLVRQAAAHGHHITAVVRPETRYEPPDGVRAVRGDVLAADFVSSVMPEHDTVASCLGMRYAHPWARRQSPDDFISRATSNIVNGMQSAGVSRISAISAAGVGESRADANLFIRFLIATSNVGVAYADLERVERILRESGLDWQAVRPTTLSHRRGNGNVRITNSYPATASIARADVAAFILRELEQAGFTARTPTITAS